tara:strand:+ start:48 stop:425 length:378 start_codon:yes stop_codon:yes gene_type:complete
MGQASTKSEQSVHSSIMESGGDEEPTMRQCSYLMFLYKAKIKSKILKKHSRLQDAKVKDFPFFVRPNRKVGTLAIHFYSTFSVNEKLSRGAVSKLINSAKNDSKFDIKLIARFLDSANSYTKATS